MRGRSVHPPRRFNLNQRTVSEGSSEGKPGPARRCAPIARRSRRANGGDQLASPLAQRIASRFTAQKGVPTNNLFELTRQVRAELQQLALALYAVESAAELVDRAREASRLGADHPAAVQAVEEAEQALDLAGSLLRKWKEKR